MNPAQFHPGHLRSDSAVMRVTNRTGSSSATMDIPENTAARTCQIYRCSNRQPSKFKQLRKPALVQGKLTVQL